MPITQSRMLSLLSAARDYEQALYAAARFIHSEFMRVQSFQLSPSEALTNIHNMVSPITLLTDPLNSAKSIALEAAHFTESTQRRNTRVAEKQRIERLGALTPHDRREQRQGAVPSPIPYPTTAPPSFSPPFYYPPSPPPPAQNISEPDPVVLANPEYQKFLAAKARAAADEHTRALRLANPNDDLTALEEDLAQDKDSSP